MIDQISVYTENKRGAARGVFSLFAKEKINVLCFVNSDSGEFGTMRIIVSDAQKAIEKLNEKGYLCKFEKIIATELEDVPGALEGFLLKIENMNVNIDYMYVGYSRENNAPLIILRCNDMDIVSKNLENSGYKLH